MRRGSNQLGAQAGWSGTDHAGCRRMVLRHLLDLPVGEGDPVEDEVPRRLAQRRRRDREGRLGHAVGGHQYLGREPVRREPLHNQRERLGVDPLGADDAHAQSQRSGQAAHAQRASGEVERRVRPHRDRGPELGRIGDPRRRAEHEPPRRRQHQ